MIRISCFQISLQILLEIEHLTWTTIDIKEELLISENIHLPDVTAIEVEQIVSEDLDVQMEEYFIFLMRSVRFEK